MSALPANDQAAHSARHRSPEHPPCLEIGGQAVLLASEATRALHRQIQRAACTPIPVLVQGETGTGKEWVAHAIHAASPRAHGPLEILHCGAIPETLIEAQLFGAERGAFTGAVRTTAGVFERARGGTVFLDELGELSPQAQVSLLRVLDGHAFHRVGGTLPIAPDVRVVAATHRDLRAAVRAGSFREDLYYRLGTVTLQVPALRERRDEVAPLARHFLALARERWGQGPAAIAPDALELLEQASWPGNVRQLRGAIESAAVRCDGHWLTRADLQPELQRRVCGGGAEHAVHCAGPRQQGAASDGDTPGTRPAPGGLRAQLREYEIRLIEAALEETRGNQRRAAALLEIPLRTLVHKLGRFGIRREPR